MKKFLSVLLCCILLLSIVPFATFAQNEEIVPFILLQGYSGPRLDDAETGEQVWGLDFEKVKARIVAALPDIAGTVGETFTGNTTQLVDILGGILTETLEPIACNPDGTSKYNLVPHLQTAEQSRVSTIRANSEENLIAEKELIAMMEGKIGSENIFIFNYDWRKGQVAYAAAIDAFVQDVKALTGAKQVDIFGLSHGGQCGASYLYYYGWKGDVRKIILDVPATGGTTMVGDPLLGNPLNLNYATIMEFVELANGSEDEFEWLIKYIGFQNLNAVLSDLCERYIVDFIKYIPSIWDFCPLDVYEQAKEKRLDPVENAALIAQSDAFHYGAMAHMHEGLVRAQKAGTNVAIITNYGHENVTGSKINSDYIIDTVTSSGAYCAPFGEHFPSDYVTKNANCANPKHMHISPERNVDASTAYLPDNTWFVNGQFHGMYVFDPYTVRFVQNFYFTNTITDVFSNPNFPQFELAQNPADNLYMRFDGTAPGYHSAADSKLLFKNLSKEYDIAIRRITVNGMDVTLSPNITERIAAGEEAYITVPAHNVADCTTPFEITVLFTLYNNQMLLKSKTFTFTPLSASDAQQYSYLVHKATAAPTKDLAQSQSEPTTAQSEAETTAPTTVSTPENKNAANPRTGTTASKILSVGILPVAVAIGITVTAVRKKREEE